METTHNTALVVIPPEAVWEPIQKIRRIYDNKIRRWMPHITLIYPFAPPSEFERIAQELSPVCEALAPVEVALERFSTFSQGKTLWLDPQPDWQIAQICRCLAGTAGLPEASRNFTPHLTVGRFRAKSELRETAAKLEKDWTPIRFTLDKVSLVHRGDPPDDVFRVDRELRLTGQSPKQRSERES